MPTTTSTYAFKKPIVGGDTDSWGDNLNENWDSTESILTGATAIQKVGIGTTNATAVPLKVSVADIADVVATFNGVTQFTGDVKITGNVKNSDNTTILAVGSDSVAAVFTGNVTGNVSGDAGTVNGKTVLKNVPANAVFTDTNTFRAITSTPANNATTTSISSHWAYNNVKTAVPINAVFTDTNTTYDAGTGITLTGTTFSANGSAINAGQVDGFSISTAASGTTANVIYFRT